jgi:hypothetical protein
LVRRRLHCGLHCDQPAIRALAAELRHPWLGGATEDGER